MTEISEGIDAEAELNALWKEFKEYIEALKRDWLGENRVESKDVFEVMRPEEQQKVYGRIRQWERYITPLSETWWQERGYSVTWPEDNSLPMQVELLKAAYTQSLQLNA